MSDTGVQARKSLHSFHLPRYDPIWLVPYEVETCTIFIGG